MFPSLEYLDPSTRPTRPKTLAETVAQHQAAAMTWAARGYGTVERLEHVRVLVADDQE